MFSYSLLNIYLISNWGLGPLFIKFSFDIAITVDIVKNTPISERLREFRSKCYANRLFHQLMLRKISLFSTWGIDLKSLFQSYFLFYIRFIALILGNAGSDFEPLSTPWAFFSHFCLSSFPYHVSQLSNSASVCFMHIVTNF